MVKTIDELATELVNWLNQQPDITSAVLVDTNVGIGADHPEIFIGRAYLGFVLDGIFCSLEVGYTE